MWRKHFLYLYLIFVCCIIFLLQMLRLSSLMLISHSHQHHIHSLPSRIRVVIYNPPQGFECEARSRSSRDRHTRRRRTLVPVRRSSSCPSPPASAAGRETKASFSLTLQKGVRGASLRPELLRRRGLQEARKMRRGKGEKRGRAKSDVRWGCGELFRGRTHSFAVEREYHEGGRGCHGTLTRG